MSSSENTFETLDQRVSYGIALNVGSNIARQGGVEIDLSAFIIGLQDGLNGAQPRVSEDDLKAAFAEVQTKIEEEAAAGAAEGAQIGKMFLNENRARAGVVVTQCCPT